MPKTKSTKSTKRYTSDDIKVLSDREHVRVRTNVYLGSMNPTTFTLPVLGSDDFKTEQVTFIPAMMKAFNEIVDNAIDELTQHAPATPKISISYEHGVLTVSDNGRGVPIDKHPVGAYTPEVVFSQLRSGRNFTDDKTVGVIGVNGVGSSCTNMCSSWFKVVIHRDGKVYTQLFEDGAGKIGKPSIRASSSSATGTTISFKLDPEVFTQCEHGARLPEIVVRNRAHEIAMTNPSFVVTYNGERIRYKGGVAEIVKKIGRPNHTFSTTLQDGSTMEFTLITGMDDPTDQMLTWVNSSLLYDGGIVNTQFMNALCDRTISHLTPGAKKAKCEVSKADVRSNLLVLSTLKLKSPEYDSQAKTRLTGPTLRKPIDDMLADEWPAFARKNKVWLESVLERASRRFHHKRNKDAIDEHRQASHRVEGLLDATSPDRQNCMLFITEGDSAKATITQARDPRIHAAFPMRGKLNNVYGASPAEVLKMEKVADLLRAIGLTPGHRADPLKMRYGYIILATDADTDGSHIVTLFINLFYRFWPELFDKKNPRIFRLMSPNVVASKGDKRVHFHTQADYAAQAEKYRNWKIEYFKGLGSMSHQDWEMVLSDLTSSCHVIYDDGKLKDTLRLHFSDDVESRRKWLMEQTTNE